MIVMIIDKQKVSGEEMMQIDMKVGVVVVWKMRINAEDDLVKKEGGRRRGKSQSLLDAEALHIHPHHLLHHHLGLVLEIERGRSTQTKDQRRGRSAAGARNLMYLLHHRRRLVMTEREKDERSKRRNTEQKMTRVLIVPKAMLSVNNQNKSIKIHRHKLILLKRKRPQSLVKVV